MKHQIKSLVVVSLLSAVLTACGNGNSGGEAPVAEDASIVNPSVAVAPQEPVADEPVNPAAPQEHQEPEHQEPQPQEPESSPLPLPGQTGWSMPEESGVETRKPLELIQAVVCAGRAQLEGHPMPVSSEACSTTYPDIFSGGEKAHLAELPPGTEIEQREGCTFMPAMEMLACKWEFQKALPGSPDAVNFWYIAPFMPTFAPAIATCNEGKDHWLPEFTAAADGRTVKAAASFPSGCMDWTDLMTYFEQGQVQLMTDQTRN